MKILLDTHVLVWWLRDNPKLGPKPRALIADKAVDVLFSAVSCWEATIKFRTGKFEMAGMELWDLALEEGFGFVGVEAHHLAALEMLSSVSGHGDPFDHLLLSQASSEDALLMTADRKMAEYGVRCIGVR